MKSKLSPNKRKNRIINELLKENNFLKREIRSTSDELKWIQFSDGTSGYIIPYDYINRLRKELYTLQSNASRDRDFLLKENQELLEYKAKYYQLIKTIKI